MPGCKSRLCMLVCGWLWVSGLLLMGKVLGALGGNLPGGGARAPNMDAVGALQIFFLLFTASCAGLLYMWRRTSAADSKGNAPGILRRFEV